MTLPFIYKNITYMVSRETDPQTSQPIPYGEMPHNMVGMISTGNLRRFSDNEPIYHLSFGTYVMIVINKIGLPVLIITDSSGNVADQTQYVIDTCPEAEEFTVLMLPIPKIET